MLHPTPKILLVLALICPTLALAQSSDEPSDHQRVDELLPPEMKAAVAQQKESRREKAENANRGRSGADAQTLVVPNHPVAVAVVDEDGNLIVTEY